MMRAFTIAVLVGVVNLAAWGKAGAPQDPIQLDTIDIQPSTFNANTTSAAINVDFLVDVKKLEQAWPANHEIVVDLKVDVTFGGAVIQSLAKIEVMGENVKKALPDVPEFLLSYSINWPITTPIVQIATVSLDYKFTPRHVTTQVLASPIASGTSSIILDPSSPGPVKIIDPTAPQATLKVLFPARLRDFTPPPMVSFDPLDFPKSLTAEGEPASQAIGTISPPPSFLPPPTFGGQNFDSMKVFENPNSKVVSNYRFPAFHFTASDTGSGLSATTLVLNGVDLGGFIPAGVSAFTLSTHPTMSLPEGESLIQLFATDRAGNVTTREATIIKDETAPVIDEVAPAYEEVVSLEPDGTFVLTAEYFDELSGIDPAIQGAVTTSLIATGGSGSLVTLLNAKLTPLGLSATVPAKDILALASSPSGLTPSEGRIVVQLGIRDLVENTAFVEFVFYVTEVPPDILQSINERLEGLAAVYGGSGSQVRHLATLEDALVRVQQQATVDGYVDGLTGLPVEHKTFYTDTRFYSLLLAGLDYDVLVAEGGTTLVTETAIAKHREKKEGSTAGREQLLAKMRMVLVEEVKWLVPPATVQTSATRFKSELESTACSDADLFALLNDVQQGQGSAQFGGGTRTAVHREMTSLAPQTCFKSASVGFHVSTYDMTGIKNSAAIKEVVASKMLLVQIQGVPPQEFPVTAAIKAGSSDFSTADSIWQAGKGLTASPPVDVVTSPYKLIDISNDPVVGAKASIPAQITLGARIEPQSLPTLAHVPNAVSETGISSATLSISEIRYVVGLAFKSMPISGLYPTGSITLDSDEPRVFVYGDFVIFDETGKALEVVPDGSLVRFKSFRNGIEFPGLLAADADPAIADPVTEILSPTTGGSVGVYLDFSKNYMSQAVKPGDKFKVVAQIESIGGEDVTSASVLESGEMTVVPGAPAVAILVTGSNLDLSPEALIEFVGGGTQPAEPMPSIAADGASLIRVKAVAYDRRDNPCKRSDIPVRWVADGNFDILNEDETLTSRGEAHALLRAGIDPSDPSTPNQYTVKAVFAGTDKTSGNSTKIETPARPVVQLPVLVTFVLPAPIAPLLIGVNDFRELEIMASTADVAVPVTDGAVVKWFANLGTITAVERVANSSLNEGIIRNGKSKARLTTVTTSPYDEDSRSFEESSESVFVSAFIGVSSEEATTKFLWPPGAPLKIEGTPVLVGDQNGPGVVEIIKPVAGQGELVTTTIPYHTTAQVVISGSPKHLVKLALRDNYASRLLYEMETLGTGGTVPDSALTNSGTASNVQLDPTTFKRGLASYKFTGTSKITVPITPSLQIVDGLIVDAQVRPATLGQPGIIARYGNNWVVSFDAQGVVTFTLSADNKTFTLKSLTALTPQVWTRVQAKRLESGDLELSVNGVVTTANASKKAINISAEPIEIGEGFDGNLDHLEIASLEDALLILEGGNTVKLDSNGIAIITVNATNMLAGRKATMRAVFIEVSGSPKVSKPVAVVTTDVFQAVSNYCDAIFDDPQKGLELILDFTIIGDIKDLIQFMIDLMPGGDSPNFLVGGISIVSLITEFVPALKVAGDIAKRTIKAGDAKKFG